MPVQALKCKECDSTYPLDARYVCEQCFGPLEVAYDHSGLDAAEAKRKIQAGPQTIWRYADFLPFAASPQPGLPGRPDAAPEGAAARRGARAGGGVDQERHG